MNLLLDTHVFVWWIQGSGRLSAAAIEAVDSLDNKVHVSAATAWEVATLLRLKKIFLRPDLASDIEATAVRTGFIALPVTFRHAEQAGRMDGLHRDPFDRMIAAQAMLEDMTVVSRDAALDASAVSRLW